MWMVKPGKRDISPVAWRGTIVIFLGSETVIGVRCVVLDIRDT